MEEKLKNALQELFVVRQNVKQDIAMPPPLAESLLMLCQIGEKHLMYPKLFTPHLPKREEQILGRRSIKGGDQILVCNGRNVCDAHTYVQIICK